jgi:hypothetical protein
VNHLAIAASLQCSPRWFMGAETGWGMWRGSAKRGSAKIRRLLGTLAGMVLLALPAAAQLQVGEYLHMDASGNVGFNYAGSEDQGLSGHGTGFTGNGTLSGNYYSPNFLNFTAQPFYNRSQSDSVFGSLTNTSGISSNVNLFGGTRFPGTVSYNTLFNDSSQFGVPGSDVGLAQHGNTQSFGIGWSALVPDWPTLTANYAINDTSNQLFGAQGNDTENDHTLTLLSTYRVDGFHLTGQFLHRNSDATFAELLEGSPGPVTSNSSTNSYSATATHSLPLAGEFGVNFTHLTYGYDYTDSYSTSNSGGSTSVNGNAGFHPTEKLGVSVFANYNDSLLGSIPQPILNNGTAVDMTSLGSFHSVLVGTDVYYQLLKNLGVHADVSHEYQSFLGQSYSATQFGGSANYIFEHSLLQGLSFSLGVVDTAQQDTNTGLGFVGTASYNRKFSGWDIGGNFSYAQNVQTVMLVYTTSSYSYLASIKRRLADRTYFLAGYSGSHSGITANSGTTSSADRVYTTLMHRGYIMNAFYTKSNGLAIFTPTGLVAIPGNLPPQVLGDNFTEYNSKGYGFGLGATTHRLTISASWAKSYGDTADPILTTNNNNTLINAIMQYRLRKIYLNGGYTRLNQAVGTPGTSPIMVTSYYIGFSRWFNFF